MLAVHVLGPVEARRDGQPVDLGGPQQRAVIAHLALDAGHVVAIDRLINKLWGDDPPRTPLGTLQSYVSRLRRAVEPARGAGSAPQVLVSEAPGYVLRVPAEHIDLHCFRRLVAEARQRFAAGDPAAALARFDEALALWRGPALGGVGPEEQVRGVVIQLEEERSAAVEDRFEVMLALGRHLEAIPLLQAAVDEQPLRERRWALLALALYRGSRQAEALRALGRARTGLLDQLGLDPGPELRQLEQRILAHDPTLAPAAIASGGGAAPLPAAAVLEAPTEAGPELVCREHEWQTLERALAAASAGRQHLVLVEGEPGIGKSTLCETFLASAAERGWHTAVGRCVDAGLAPSLWPCIEVVRSMLAEQPGSSPELAANPLARLVTGGEPTPSFSAVELAGHFTSLIDQLGAQPWVLLLDDLHWADAATLDMVRLVLERLGPRRLLLLGAYRPVDAVPGSLLGDALGGLHRADEATSRVHVSALNAAGVARLMELTTGVAPTSDVADRVRARAGGNPLFVAELARLVGERGLSAEQAVPAAIRDVVRSRLAQLPDRATAELEVAAVLGERFDLRAAMAASERDPDGCLDALDSAIVTRILVPEAGGFRFAHALVRDAVLAEIAPLRLARLHHRAAEALAATYGDGPDVAEPIAHHRLAAAAFADPLVIAKAAVRASDVARWRNALETADHLAEQALDVLAGVPRTPALNAVEVEALEALVSVAFRREQFGPTDPIATRVRAYADRAGSDAARALTLFLEWGDIDGTDDLRTMAADVERARALAAATTDSYALVTAHYMVGSFAFLLGHFAEAAENTDVAIAASGTTDPDQRPEHVPLVLLPVVAGLIAAMRGRTEEARTHSYRRITAWLSQRSEVDTTAAVALAFNRALIEALLGDPRAVLDQLDGVERTSEHGFIAQQAATCDILEGWARARLGDAAGLEQAMTATAAYDAGRERVLESMLRTFLADACIAVGDGRAVDLLTRARGEALARGEVWWLAETLRLSAVADRRFAGGTHADAWLEEAEQLATAQGAALLLPRIAASRVSPEARRPTAPRARPPVRPASASRRSP